MRGGTMQDLDSLRGSIKLDGESLFFHYLSQNKEKLEMYLEGLKSGKISFFDQSLLTRLRKMYFGYYSAIIYLFATPTSFSNIGNKVELLAHALDNKEYRIVHGETDSTRKIPFFMYGVEHLDFNSWIEVEEGNRTWVYDTFSLMRFDKELFYSLENPKITSIIPKSRIHQDDYDDRQFRQYTNGFDFMLLKIIPALERSLSKHPFKSILETEISRFKSCINYDDIELQYKVFKKEKF